ncbi:MAG TPA: asparagine synthase-related protein, partial [Gemmatimonadales bacterium]|nr:asparagine synthase-related protein [Gemmatimonadales bacterium]
VLEFALDLPDRWLLRRNQGKLLLRRLLRRYLPAELFQRPKQGFSVPLRDWFRGALTAAFDPARCEALFDSGFIRREGVTQLLDAHARGHRDHSQRLFNLVVLGRWLEACA